MDANAERKSWERATQEARVERFYSHGVARYGEYHGGYLNFGLWEPGVSNYVEAAENLIRTLASWGRIGADSRVLDVGCGLGAQDMLLARTVRPRSIDGVDVTWDHVHAARRRAAQMGVADRVRFHHGSATGLPFVDGHFTHAIGVEGPVHFDTREAFMREAYRVLAPGGVLLLADYTLKGDPRRLGAKLVVELARRGWYVPEENCDTTERYREKLERCGFATVELRSVGHLTYPKYFREQVSLRHLKHMRSIRGLRAMLGGIAIDFFAYEAWALGLADYVLVRAVKPSAQS